MLAGWFRQTILTMFLGMCLDCAASPASDPAPVSKHHTAVIGGKKIGYTASLDRFTVQTPEGRPGGTINTISYVRDGASAGRPVVFAFNGGPGSSSLTLNVGFLGPYRIDLPVDPAVPVPSRVPYVPNADSILDVADIVLIDPVGTGFSKLLEPAARSYFYSTDGDAKSVADAIEAWSQANGRQTSPKFIFGESYGAVRAVRVSNVLNGTSSGGNVRGVILLSQSLQIIDTVQRRSNAVGQIVGLPTLAATAWYHGLAGKGRVLDEFVAEASTFAREDWLPALVAGTRLPADQRVRIAERLSTYIGVPTKYLLEHDLYITKETYRRIALADKGLILGLFDTRYTGPLPGEKNPDGAISAAISSAAADMFEKQLGISGDGYARSSSAPGQPGDGNWAYLASEFSPSDGETFLQIDYVADLLRLMKEQPRVRVLVAGGWYDTAASAGADDYLMSRPGLDLGRISAERYVGGHMFYTDPKSRAAFASGLRELIAQPD